jgi:phage baseplate assembly protein W
MRREYGSLVPAIIDHPDNALTQIRLFAAIASALQRWEPRLQLQKVSATRQQGRPGYADIEIVGSYVGSFGREPAAITLSVPLSTWGVAA